MSSQGMKMKKALKRKMKRPPRTLQEVFEQREKESERLKRIDFWVHRIAGVVGAIGAIAILVTAAINF